MIKTREQSVRSQTILLKVDVILLVYQIPDDKPIMWVVVLSKLILKHKAETKHN